jgi:hypothetical protein
LLLPYVDAEYRDPQKIYEIFSKIHVECDSTKASPEESQKFLQMESIEPPAKVYGLSKNYVARRTLVFEGITMK